MREGPRLERRGGLERAMGPRYDSREPTPRAISFVT